MMKLLYSVVISSCLSSLLIADQKEAEALIKKIDILQQQLDMIDQKVDQLEHTNRRDKKEITKPPMTPLEKQAASSAIFIPGGQPKAPQKEKNTEKDNYSTEQNSKDKPDSLDKSTSNPDAQAGLSDNSSTSSPYSDLGYSDDSGYGYSTPVPQADRLVTLSLNNYTSNTYQYDTSTSTVSFTFLTDVILSLKFSNFSVYNLKVCNSSYASCTSITQTDTNQYQLTTDQLNAVSANLGTSQIILNSETFMVPVFYLTYTSTSDSSTALTGYFSFPTSSSSMSCSTTGSTATCQLTQSSQVNFNRTN
ncbi:hypothetical protein L3V79_00050 [Thiotrichales bacterium 19S9-12]|nr:hypothetical protein [Thiotrichales bacterium 19S9-11]MCF6810759.1 hypothetical protein [Thiotrichales bacterium 19S9-12]